MVRLSTDRRHVWEGRKSKTDTGMTKAQLTRSKTDKIVSKKKSRQGRKAAKDNFAPWRTSVARAAKERGVVPPRGPVLKSHPLYPRAKQLLR